MLFLGFLAGWAAATAWWAYVDSLYEKPLPPQDGNVRLETNGSRTVRYSRPARLPHWLRDSGP